jgi:phosphotransferase system IIA component
VRFDLEKIRRGGYDPITPIVVTNADEHPVSNLETGEVSTGDPLFEVAT